MSSLDSCIPLSLYMLLLHLIYLAHSGYSAPTTGFVEEVSCSSRSMIVVLNKSDPDVIRWRRDPAARPVVYVYGHKERTPCGLFLKSPDNSSYFLNFTIPYGPVCSVQLTDLEPNHQTAETSVAIEDHAAYGHSRPIRIHHVFCIYTKRVEAIRMNDVSVAHEVIASTGGKPKPKVQLLFRDPSGKPLRAARFGDSVGLYLMLDPDNAYKGIIPKHCVFSDRDRMEEPSARTLTFIQSDCPVKELSEIVEPVQDVDEEIYFTRFQAFRFGDKPTVFAHCTVEVCLESDTCNKNCFGKVKNTSLTPELLRHRLRRSSAKKRYQRSVASDMSFPNLSKQQVAVSNFLTVLDEMQTSEVVADKIQQCSSRSPYYLFLAAVGFFSVMLLFLGIVVAFLIIRLKKGKPDPYSRLPFSLLPGNATIGTTPHNVPSPVWTERTNMKNGSSLSWNKLSEISIPRITTLH
uniref:ZP domain-containing protein n=1 Tax=Trichuris muris TaxID=70415 RepID=A0A5S6R124_TRIMR